MAKKKNHSKQTNAVSEKQTNFWDVLIAFGSGIINLLKVEKVIVIIMLYLIGRDMIFVSRLPQNADYQAYLIDTTIIEKIFESDNTTIMVLALLGVLFLITTIILIITIKVVYKKEIDRLANERSKLLHGLSYKDYETLKTHRSSNEK